MSKVNKSKFFFIWDLVICGLNVTSPYIFKDFENVIDGQLLSSAAIFVDTVVKVRTKRDYLASLVVSRFVEGGLERPRLLRYLQSLG